MLKDVLANTCKNQFESQKTNSSEEWKVIKRGPSGIYRNEQNDINLINCFNHLEDLNVNCGESEVETLIEQRNNKRNQEINLEKSVNRRPNPVINHYPEREVFNYRKATVEREDVLSWKAKEKKASTNYMR